MAAAAAAASFRRPLPAAVLCSAILLVVLIAVAAPPASASQLNLYKGKWCTGSFTVCWDRQCCNIPSDAVSYKFYYNPTWRGYLYSGADCTGYSTAVLANDFSCVQGVDFKSAKLTDGSYIQEVTEAEK